VNRSKLFKNFKLYLSNICIERVNYKYSAINSKNNYILYLLNFEYYYHLIIAVLLLGRRSQFFKTESIKKIIKE
jgi:hypothetical protein